MPTDLGLKSKYRDPASRDCLAADVLRAIERIADEDFAPLREGFLRSGAAKDDQLDVAERELKRFFAMLVLARHGLISNDRLGPTKRVDQLWHVFLLDTRRYQRFCDVAVGDFVHHTPGPRDDDGNEMRRLLRRFFENVDGRRTWRGALHWCWPE